MDSTVSHYRLSQGHGKRLVDNEDEKIGNFPNPLKGGVNTPKGVTLAQYTFNWLEVNQVG